MLKFTSEFLFLEGYFFPDLSIVIPRSLQEFGGFTRTLLDLCALFVAVGRREGIHQSVAPDVAAIFKGKTASQLQALQSQIETKITDKTQGVDIGYWESLLSQLKGTNSFYSLKFKSCDYIMLNFNLV